jgi:tetratricopeptide (TPR) repeat protein
MRNMFALDSLGWVCMRLNRLDESARNLEGALKIATANYGSLSTFTLRSKVTLAEVLNKLGRADEAEVLCTELKTQVQQNRDNGTPLPKDSISQLNTLAAVYVQQKKFDEAIETYGAIVDDRKKIFGDAHPMTLWATMQWAIAKESKGSLEEALRMFEDLLPKQIKILGETHPDVKEGKSRLQGLKSRLALVESENI